MEAEIDSRAFEEIMDDFVEVHKAASEDVDIGVVLADVKITLQASAKKYKDFLSSFLLSCDTAKAKVQSFIKRLGDAKDEAANKVNNTWLVQLAKGRKGIKDSQSNTNTTVARLEKVGKQMAKIIIDYHSGVTETDAKLSVVKQLRDIIEDELLNSAGKSFIQVEKFNAKLKDLQALIRKSGDTMYTPIIETLVQLASEQNFSDQKILQAILKNLKALEDNLRKFKAGQEYAMNATLSTLKAQEENLSGQLEDLLHLEQRYTSDVAEANQNIELLNTHITNFNSEIARKQDELKAVQHLCDTENEMFKAGQQRMDLIKKDLDAAAGHNLDLHK